MTFSETVEIPNTSILKEYNTNLIVAHKFELEYLKETKTGQRLLENAFIKFHPLFGNYVHEHPVPVDMETMVRISTTQGDVLTWASKKAPTLKKPIRIPMASLVKQFYDETKYPSKFFPAMWDAIDTVKKEYTKLRVDLEDNGKIVVLKHSDPYVDPEKAKSWLRMGRTWLDEEIEQGLLK